MRNNEIKDINEESVYDAFLRCELLREYSVLIVANNSQSARDIINYVFEQASSKRLYIALTNRKIVFQKNKSSITVVSSMSEIPRLRYNHIICGSDWKERSYLEQHLTNYWE